MFRTVALRASSLCRTALSANKPCLTAGSVRLMSKHSTESDEQFDSRYKLRNFNNFPYNKQKTDL